MSVCIDDRIVELASLVTEARFLQWNDDDRLAEARTRTRALLDRLGWSDDCIDRVNTAVAEYESYLRSLPYDEYLRTAHWQTVRQCALRLAEYRCQICNGSSRLHVHHRTYRFRGGEGPYDLTVLCAGCHQLFHENRRLAR